MPADIDDLRAEADKAAKAAHHERFVDYLASNFQPARPLRHERKIQRNKAILVLVLLGVIVVWLIARRFL